ncbi:hypothetical protein D5S17_35730 [Pseudonocardiaceae bacterium YIM PH 21723]|nr:hypothetical protein D5S17_35730 [Pseudonocardiaceae bacterium YIM PH 21723]
MPHSGESQIFTPLAEPVFRAGCKELGAEWALGPGASEAAPFALLVIQYVAETSRYQAWLTGALRTNFAPDLIMVSRTAAAFRAMILLGNWRAEQCSAERLEQLRDECLAEVRSRFEAGDQDVTVHFDPTSALYAEED